MTGAMPLISVITPAFNAASTLGAAIDSLRAQTLADWEMIIIDDCSQDGTTALAERYASDDERIRIIRRAENGGAAAARNVGLEVAKGRYIAFLDADDVWLPNKLQSQLDFMKEHKVAISYTACRRFGKDTAQAGRLLKARRRLVFEHFLRQNPVVLVTVMIDGQMIEPFQFDELRAHEDLALWLRLTRDGYDIAGLNIDLVRIRETANNNWLRSAWPVWRIYRDLAGLKRSRALASLGSYGWHALWRAAF